MKAIISILVLLLFASLGHAQNPVDLFLSGQTEEAKKGYEQALIAAEKSGDPATLWNALMAIAWFEHNVGELQQSLEHSNRSLEVASSLGDDFRTGRSLDWIGWSYAAMGLYDLALSFYQNAVELGAPQGEVKIAFVWGLALQEMGGIYLKMGKLDDAKRALEKTYSYAKEHHIGVGIAEGGVYLAEIALLEGDAKTALEYSEQAVRAASDNTVPVNTARAKIVLAKTLLETSQHQPDRRAKALASARDALAYAEKLHLKPSIAEAKVLLSRALPTENFDERYALVTSALELLVDTKSEFRGTGEAEVGRLFLEKNDSQLADFYLKRGIRVNKQLFRKVDNAYLTVDLANLSALQGSNASELLELSKAAEEAKKLGALPLLLNSADKLSARLFETGYFQLSASWADEALDALGVLTAKETDEIRKKELLKQGLGLTERRAEALLRVTSGTRSPE